MINDTVKRQQVAERLREVGIVLTPSEVEQIELADFGLGRFDVEGLALLVYVNNDRYCAKELVMSPHQTCPEHRHPPVPASGDNPADPGKRETFRCRAGRVYLYVEGPGDAADASVEPPAESRRHYTVLHEVSLGPGEQFTIEPDLRHWFKAGPDGAIVSEFSSPSRDQLDVFTDPHIRRTD